MNKMNYNLPSEMSQTLKPKTQSQIQKEQKADKAYKANLNFGDLNGLSNEIHIMDNKKLSINLFDERKTLQELE